MTHEQTIRNSRNCCSTRTCGSSRHVSRPSLTRLPTRRTMMRAKLLYPLERKVSDGTDHRLGSSDRPVVDETLKKNSITDRWRLKSRVGNFDQILTGLGRGVAFLHRQLVGGRDAQAKANLAAHP